MPDGRLILPQAGEIHIVSGDGKENVVLSDKTHPPDQTVVCGGGRYIVYRQLAKASKTSINLWRMDINGSNPTQLTFGHNESNMLCAADDKWLYFVDVMDNFLTKRVPLTGGTPETFLDSALPGPALSPDGKALATLEVRELDHKMTLKLISTEDKKISYHDVDQRASWPLAFTRDGKAVVYNVREKGVDNLWVQPLDGSNYSQLTHFPSERIAQFAYSFDGKTLAVERGHYESDAVLIRDTSK